MKLETALDLAMLLMVIVLWSWILSKAFDLLIA